MARPLRVEYPEACYHIINRGNRREDVFKSANDFRLFLDKLEEYTQIFDIVVHSYCLMPNHFHLQLQTLNGNLGKFMQSFLTSFTLTMNKRYNKSGHLFQGRYKAQLVETEKYRNKLSRYIHLNPVKISFLDDVSADEIINKLINYKWSSYRAYLGLEDKPVWLNCSHVLSYWGDKLEEQVIRYSDYVESGIESDNSEELQTSELSHVIGTENFTEHIISKYLVRNLSHIDEREQPVLKKINTPDIERVVTVVAEYFDVGDHDKIYTRRRCNIEARKTAMYLASKHCRSNSSLTSISGAFGVKVSGLNMARDRFNDRLKNEIELIEAISEIEKHLDVESV